MKTILLLASAVFLGACTSPETGSPEMQENTAMETPANLLRHVVLFSFKEEATKEQLDEVVSTLMALPSTISEIHSAEWGTNSSPEGLADGFTHAFFITFLSDEARDTYLTHPDHMAFVDLLPPVLNKVLVVDYWTHQ